MIESIIVSILTGIASSIVASWMFLRFFAQKMRPKFEISSEIALEDENSSKTFRFKIINRSKFPVYDIKIRLYKVLPSVGTSSTVMGQSIVTSQTYNFENVPLSSGEITKLERFNLKDENAFYAVRVRCFANIEENWQNGVNFYRLEVSGCHSLSGLRATQTQDFVNPRICLRRGSFHNGPDLAVH